MSILKRELYLSVLLFRFCLTSLFILYRDISQVNGLKVIGIGLKKIREQGPRLKQQVFRMSVYLPTESVVLHENLISFPRSNHR